jgi:hypothetical protein
MEALTVRFVGPFSWLGTADAPSIFEGECSRGPGIYLWAVARPEGYLVYYVGETGRSFAVRMQEHYKEHAACFYHLYSPAEFATGVKLLVWPGRYDPEEERSTIECVGQYSRLAPYVAELTSLYRFLVAPLSADARVRRRIEAALALSLYSQPDPIGSFQDRGIRYSPRLPEEDPIPCNFASVVPVLGLPGSLSI